MTNIPFLKPNLPTADDLVPYLREIDGAHLYSNYGPLVTRFERRLLETFFAGRGALVTVCNATLGLMLAIRAVKRPGRYALMPSFTFAATPLAAQWCGLEPYFVDIDPHDWTMDAERVRDIVARLGDDIAVVVPYATFGTCLDLAPWSALVERGVPVVIDAAASVGARDGLTHFGAGFPGLVVYSLHATKPFGIGEGGFVHGADADRIAQVRRLANFGFDAARAATDFGLNAKMTEYAAAVGLAQFDRFPAAQAKRDALRARYTAAFAASGLLANGRLRFPDQRGSVPHQFLPLAVRGGSAVALRALQAQGIEARTYFAPACHQQAQFAGCARGDLANTDALAREVLSLPLWEAMSAADVERVAATLVAGVNA